MSSDATLAKPLPNQLKASQLSAYQRFAELAVQQPDHPAIVIAEQTVSYAQLNHRAAQLAELIHQHCPHPAQRIALLFEQGVDAIAAMLAVMKSGNTFICLDVDDPAQRLQHILEDSQVSLILSEADSANLAKQLAQAQFPVIETSQADALDGHSDNDVSALKQPTVAYLLYTSGSTGRPKGVCQTDSNLQYYIGNYVNSVGVSADDRLTLLFSTSFAASLMDIFSALLTGATLYPYNIRKHGLHPIGQWVRAHNITVLHMVPSVFRHLMKELDSNEVLDSVRAIDLGGETVFASDLALFRQHFLSGTRFINHYAASEISVICQLDVATLTHGDTPVMPAGRPADGTVISIRDSKQQPLPAGQVGEIHVHSRFLSPGYWQQPELTAAAFTTDSERSDAVFNWRIYRTGDQGRLDDNGYLAVVGRAGSRVKIHGHSVDIQEVESALSSLNIAIELAVVVVGDKQDRLAACLAGVSPNHQQVTAIRQALSEKLPRYMLPTYLRFFDSLPKTATGKVDRRALQQENWQASDATPSEEHLVDDKPLTVVMHLFQRYLKNPHAVITPKDDFFLLGGDSLAFADLFAELEKHYRVSLDLATVMNMATARQLADAVVQAQQHTEQQPYPQLVQVKQGQGLPVFFVHGAGGFLFTSREFLENLGDHPVFTYQARGLDGMTTPHQSVEDMATDYIKDMQRIQPEGPYLLGGTCSGSITALEMARQLSRQGHTVAPLIMLDPPLHRHGHGLKNLLRISKGYASLARHWYRTYVANAKRKRRTREKLRTRLVSDAANPKAVDIDEAKVRMTMRTRHQLKHNLVVYRLPDYSGPLSIITTGDRMRQRYDDLGFSGQIRTYFAGQGHHQFTQNPEFIPALHQCMQDIDAELAKR